MTDYLQRYITARRNLMLVALQLASKECGGPAVASYRDLELAAQDLVTVMADKPHRPPEQAVHHIRDGDAGLAGDRA